ncbi:uncharacterized protein LOC106095105 [Stomoxys calcitrans]|uniref:Uncharacterized protein n=1 Tax=Stomoxys calcitrans TaxID=35570 RepID=A0A1I8NMB2_STOCA|nr:uncharacterized protein LOC106095105 [Stomoxys calcitrans]
MWHVNLQFQGNSYLLPHKLFLSLHRKHWDRQEKMMRIASLFLVLLLIAACRAGIIRHDTTPGSMAYSHQSITHIRREAKPRILSTPSLTANSHTSRKVKFPSSKEESSTSEKLQSSQPPTNTLVSEDPYITYKEQTPVFKSPLHTPAHLTYSAHPVVYKMLPMIVPAPYISYDKYLTSRRQ